ncbi:MAG: prepilin-type N-terminal cleavage/methylation domain-containing protein [Chthoniobacteraceae bacterium]|jgi:prepilin-type processing-associated H-X9-DG protein/prepilin-type N-terminal cleavage/methylation domain-containing protein
MNRPCVNDQAAPAPMRRSDARGFTMIELLVTVTLIAVLAVLTYQGTGQMRAIAQGAYCANSLRQLGMATSLYLADHHYRMFPYEQSAPGGALWYFGYETAGSLASSEGDRTVDVTRSPLYPYLMQVGGVEICPSFPYNCLSIWEPKYNGASWGYGFNATEFPAFSNVDVTTIRDPSQILLFGDCAQVDTFQPPGTPTHPMLEEFYMFDPTDKTTHFRHGGQANILFLDGHVEKFSMYPGTLDTRLPSANVGRITPAGSKQYLQ